MGETLGETMGRYNRTRNLDRLIRDSVANRRDQHTRLSPKVVKVEQVIDPTSPAALEWQEELRKKEIVAGTTVTLPQGTSAIVEKVTADGRVYLKGWDSPFLPKILRRA